MRQTKKLSFRQAGKLIGLSGSYVNHVEHGRMDFPKHRLDQLLLAYGFSVTEFAEYQNGKDIPIVSIMDECLALLGRVNEEKLRTVHAVLLGFVS